MCSHLEEKMTHKTCKSQKTFCLHVECKTINVHTLIYSCGVRGLHTLIMVMNVMVALYF